MSQLSHIPKFDLQRSDHLSDEPCLYFLEENGFKFDFLWNPARESRFLFILFSGDALRKKLDPPVFQRWKWAHHFPGHCLYVSDPSLYLYEKLGLAWYAGTSNFDPAPVIASVVNRFASQLEIEEHHIWTYGSSGGGFAALRMLEFLPKAGAVAINPQTNILSYSAKSVELFLRVCFEGRSRARALQEFPHRLSLLNNPVTFQGRPIIYLQNTLDTHHYYDHYLPFCQILDVNPLPADAPDLTQIRINNFTSIHFYHPGGHKGAETPEAFNRALSTIQTWAPQEHVGFI